MTSIDHRRSGWWGFVFTAAFVASLVAGGALAVGKTLYLPGASAAQLRHFYSTNGLAVAVQSGLQMVAALALLLFGRRLRASGRAVYGGAVAASGFLGLSVLLSVLLTVVAASATDAVLSGLGRAALICGGALHLLGTAVLIRSASTGVLRSGTPTRWVFRYGLVAGPLIALACVSVLWSPLIKLEPLFRLLAIVWIVGVAVAVLRGRIGGTPEPAS
ncbi:hypothetical protein [Micromonospora avicenniae]|uniref:hypothetical protein n=1 Tax=Micromonospora avicenniae TaxID=1198245 RepID=UPI0011157F8D|nr:hypothetical protein [Micromonospora avicenniae]